MVRSAGLEPASLKGDGF